MNARTTPLTAARRPFGPLFNMQYNRLGSPQGFRMYQDRYGYPLTTASEASAASYAEGLDLIFSAWTGAGEALDRAITQDPNFALAYIARARVHQIYAETIDVRTRAAQARSLAKTTTKRERQHIEILARAVEGQPAAERLAWNFQQNCSPSPTR
jgi:hypothetical protein